jgi:nucleoside-diphosphate-sugar epimerase
MNNLKNNKPKNFNLFVRGSKSRLGKEIIKYFMLKNSGSTVVEVSRFGGSFAYVINDINSANVFFITNGKTTNTSSKQDCEFETQKLCQLLSDININQLLNPGDLIVFISSGGTVYGNGSEIKTESSALNPGTYYAHSKILQERLIIDWATSNGVKPLVLRVANAYLLNNEKPGGLIELLLLACRGGDPVQIKVDPTSRKQYGLAGDYAKSFLEYIYSLNFTKFNQNFLNIASSHIYSIDEILKIVSKRYKTLEKIPYIYNHKDILPLETVILGSNFVSNHSNQDWTTLEKALE